MEQAVALRAEADEIENELAERAEQMVDEFLHSQPGIKK
jgi:hypothetical protein